MVQWSMRVMDFRKILSVVARAGKVHETVEIYYPRTDRTPGGWREVEPYSLATDIGNEGEHLVYGQDLLSPGHIFNAHTVDSGDKHCDSFIISKIKQARLTGHKFKPRLGWQVEF